MHFNSFYILNLFFLLSRQRNNCYSLFPSCCSYYYLNNIQMMCGHGVAIWISRITLYKDSIWDNEEWDSGNDNVLYPVHHVFMWFDLMITVEIQAKKWVSLDIVHSFTNIMVILCGCSVSLKSILKNLPTLHFQDYLSKWVEKLAGVKSCFTVSLFSKVR